MRYKTIALMLSLAVATWAQTAGSNPQANTTPTEKTKCACCDKTSAPGARDGQSCARHMMQSSDGKQTASCCGKNGKSCCGKDAQCMKGDKPCCSDCSNDKTASSCCGTKCGEKCGVGCCGSKKGTASIGHHNTLQSCSTRPSDSALIR
jgi:hypothetical protein